MRTVGLRFRPGCSTDRRAPVHVAADVHVELAALTALLQHALLDKSWGQRHDLC
jgi:hypothetical protein